MRTVARSNLTQASGTLFSTDAAWNRPLGDDMHHDPLLTRRLQSACRHLVVQTGPLVRHVFETGADAYVCERGEDDQILAAHHGRIPIGIVSGGADYVIVDHVARTVLSARDWRYEGDRGWRVDDLDVAELDDDGWGSPAVGLVLERELLNGRIDHAVGLWAPDMDLYGMWVRLTHVPTRGDPVEITLARALHQYGGIVVGHNGHLHEPGLDLVVLVESSRASSPGDQVGPSYRHLGIGVDPWPVRLPIADLEVLV